MRWLFSSNESKKAKAHRSSRAGHSSSTRETYPQNSTAYGGSFLEYRIQEMIQGLPRDLKKKNSTHGGESSSLCDLHWSLNHHLVDDILRLVKREVTSHFRQLDAYPDLIEPMEAEILHRLRALKGLWTKPIPEGSVVPNAWPYQINGCAACILARIASDKDALCNLRVVIQSRTRTRKNHRPRELNIFVDHCINRFNPVEAKELHTSACQLAFGMKRARKACVKAYIRNREDDPERQTRRKRRDHSMREDHVRRRRAPSIPFTTASEDNLVIAPGQIPSPLTMYYPQDRDSSENCDKPRSRRSDAPSPESPLFKRFNWGSQEIFSEVEWGNLAKQSEKVTMYRNLAGDNPYSRATPVLEAMVDPLGVQKTRRYSESSLALFQPGVCALDGDSTQNGMSSGSISDWTGDKCEDLNCDVSARRGAISRDTTWSLVCGPHNLI